MKKIAALFVLLTTCAGTQLTLFAGKQATMRFVGDIHSAKADALVTFEQMREYILMAGEIRSNRFTYTFTADIYSDSGFGQMLDHSQKTRFQIKIHVFSDGFALTSNPLGPGTPTTYLFKKI